MIFCYLNTTIRPKLTSLDDNHSFIFWTSFIYFFFCLCIWSKHRVFIDSFLLIVNDDLIKIYGPHLFLFSFFFFYLFASFIFIGDYLTKIYFFCLCMRIRRKKMVLFYFFVCSYLTVRPKIRIFINLSFLLVHAHFTQIKNNSYSLIYSLLKDVNISYAIFIVLMPLYFVRYIHGYRKS